MNIEKISEVFKNEFFIYIFNIYCPFILYWYFNEYILQIIDYSNAITQNFLVQFEEYKKSYFEGRNIVYENLSRDELINFFSSSKAIFFPILIRMIPLFLFRLFLQLMLILFTIIHIYNFSYIILYAKKYILYHIFEIYMCGLLSNTIVFLSFVHTNFINNIFQLARPRFNPAFFLTHLYNILLFSETIILWCYL